MKKQDIAPITEAAAPSIYTGPTGLAENITTKDLRLPRIALLQSKSPQVEQQEDKYKAGMLIDTLTQEAFTKPLKFVPAFIFKNVIKWKPRSEGGGIVYKTLDITGDVLKDIQWNGSDKPKADLYINAVCLVQGYDVPFIVSFCKTSLKAGQDLATLAQLSGCAWKFTYELDSVKVAGTQGTYYVLRVRRSVLSNPEEFSNAAALFEQVQGMAIDTDFEGTTHDEAPAASTEPLEF